jgi:hypothetical protein
VVHQPIRRGNHCLESGFAGGVAKVHRNAFFVAIDPQKPGADSELIIDVPLPDDISAAPVQFSRTWSFDLDYLGSHVGEYQ